MALTIGIAPDSFKGTLSAAEAAEAMARGAASACPDARILKLPMADGGEGTAELLALATGGRLITLPSQDPLGRPLNATVAQLGDHATWAIDTAAASGLTLLAPHERTPLTTCSTGTGLLIRHAIERGARSIILGLGGSATVDGGKGLCQALGFRWLDEHGRTLDPGGGSLVTLARVDGARVAQAVSRTRIRVAYDVRSPLTGPQGAATIFGPQKGASGHQIVQLEQGLERLARVLAEHLPSPPEAPLERLPGTGAAGGIGASLMALLGATLEPGGELVFELAGWSEHLAQCDLVVVAEGRLDAQTAAGKAPAIVASHARRQGIDVLAVAGHLGPGSEQLPGITDVEAVYADPPVTLPSSHQAGRDLADATHRLLLRVTR